MCVRGCERGKRLCVSVCEVGESVYVCEEVRSARGYAKSAAPGGQMRWAGWPEPAHAHPLCMAAQGNVCSADVNAMYADALERHTGPAHLLELMQHTGIAWSDLEPQVWGWSHRCGATWSHRCGAGATGVGLEPQVWSDLEPQV